MTKKEDWEEYWEKISLPVEVTKSKRNAYINEILSIFDRYLQSNPEFSILEIGGAPGGYLAYMHKRFGYKITGMDYSEIGCAKMKENFRLLGINGEVIQQDLFDNNPTSKKQFD
ncbi:MAG: class I SAM-dependent methyltransferase, partial [candidate division Zixibacteria bacterium]|nr:class I SAM-dependent methyltransferase [candidate division Zixibacteria bacterium]